MNKLQKAIEAMDAERERQAREDYEVRLCKGAVYFGLGLAAIVGAALLIF